MEVSVGFSKHILACVLLMLLIFIDFVWFWCQEGHSLASKNANRNGKSNVTELQFKFDLAFLCHVSLLLLSSFLYF